MSMPIMLGKLSPTPESQVPIKSLLRELACDYTRHLKKHHVGNLVAMILFGSVARGTVTAHSDIDLLTVFHRLPPGRMARRSYLGDTPPLLAKKLLRLHGRGIHTDFNVLIKTVTEAQTRTPFTYELVQDGLVLFDEADFFNDLKAGVKKRMRELGSQWRQIGKFRYMDLKPDMKPGEIFEL